MTYEEWEVEIHERVKREPVWEFLGYRKALFLYDLAGCRRTLGCGESPTCWGSFDLLCGAHPNKFGTPSSPSGALFNLSDRLLVWEDCEKLMRDRRGRAIAEQLIRSAGSISANIEEGHGRGYGKQRNWFFTVSIGSARESKGWYWRARKLLSAKVLDHRLALADEVIALLISELSRQRSR